MNIQTHAHTHSVHTPAHAHTPEHTHAHTLGHTLAHPLVRVGETGAGVTDRPNGEVSPIGAYSTSALPLGLILRGQAGQGNRTGITGQAWQALGMAGMTHSMGIVQAYGQAQAGIGLAVGQAVRLAQAGLIAGAIALQTARPDDLRPCGRQTSSNRNTGVRGVTNVTVETGCEPVPCMAGDTTVTQPPAGGRQKE